MWQGLSAISGAGAKGGGQGGGGGQMVGMVRTVRTFMIRFVFVRYTKKDITQISITQKRECELKGCPSLFFLGDGLVSHLLLSLFLLPFLNRSSPQASRL